MNVAARGWLHEAWSTAYYPADLPPEWRLAYYANEFPAVLVPADYWTEQAWPDTEQWRADIPDRFRIFVEVDHALVERGLVPRLLRSLPSLGETLGGVLLLTDDDEACSLVIDALRGSSDVSLACVGTSRSGLLPIWRETGSSCPCAAVGVLDPPIETTPVSLRRVIESFAGCVATSEGWLFAGDDLGLVEDLTGMARLLGL